MLSQLQFPGNPPKASAKLVAEKPVRNAIPGKEDFDSRSTPGSLLTHSGASD